MARDKKKEQQTDTYLLEKIQPQGGITFMDAKYISTGGGYEACLHIFEYPKTLDDYWLANICNIPTTAVFIDIATDDVISYLDIKLREEFKNFAIVRSQVIIVEVTANNVNKATAINSILDEWKLDKNEIIAFGDSNNDLEMLDYVGVGVAMGNASDNVKNQSDYVTLDNDSDGIYYALKHFGII